MGLKDTDFVDISAYLRVQEKRLLDASSLDRAADSPNLPDTMRMLSQNSDYDFTSLPRPEDYEGMLKEELKRIYTLARSLSKSRELVDLFACKYDYHNLKAALKADRFPQRSAVPYIRVTELEPEVLEALAKDPAVKAEIPTYIREAASKAIQAFARSENPQDIDLVLDRCMYAHMLELCNALENDFLTGYVQMSIDFYNLKALLRVKSMGRGTAFLDEVMVDGGLTPTGYFLEHYNKNPTAMTPVFYYKHFGEAMRLGVEAYEKTGNFSALERHLDNLLIAHTRQAKYIAFGPELLASYILSKENEIRQIRIVITCKANGISPDVLKERLRESYA